MKKILVLIGVMLVFVGCTEQISQEGKYDCEVDSDCTNSCQEGAVSSEWYFENMDFSQECLDGCNGPWSDAPQCIESQCVAFTLGEQDAGCTNR